MENSKQKIYNKFSLSKDENIFLAKRNLIDNIYKSARLEGIAVTFPQTEAIFNGVNVSTLKVDDVVAINNLKYAWQFIFDTMEYPKVDFAFVCEVNRIIGAGLYHNAGFLRSVTVSIGGTTWQPDFPIKADIIADIDKINNKNYVKLLDKEAKLNSWEEKANEITNKLSIYENKGVIK